MRMTLDRFLPADSLTRVFNDFGALWNVTLCENAITVNPRLTNHNQFVTR
jgi:hypothetical protein